MSEEENELDDDVLALAAGGGLHGGTDSTTNQFDHSGEPPLPTTIPGYTPPTH